MDQTGCGPVVTPPLIQGLKTGMYYLRTRPAANAIQFTVDTNAIKQARTKQEPEQNGSSEETRAKEDAMACSLNNREACVMCSS